jgi:aspartate racemase
MKTIGLIGGMSWESTAVYYSLLNREVQSRLKGHHSAAVLIHSLDFHEVAARQQSGAWDELGEMLAGSARALAAGGAHCLLIGANTMHKVAPAVAAATTLPLLHIVDITCQAVRGAGLRQVALLGTRYTMEDGFWAARAAQNGVEAVVPDAPARDELHRIIYDELVRGVVRDESRRTFIRIMNEMAENGAQGVALGCTEFGMLVQQEFTHIPLFDTTMLHALAAVDWALADTT